MRLYSDLDKTKVKRVTAIVGIDAIDGGEDVDRGARGDARHVDRDRARSLRARRALESGRTLWASGTAWAALAAFGDLRLELVDLVLQSGDLSTSRSASQGNLRDQHPEQQSSHTDQSRSIHFPLH